MLPIRRRRVQRAPRQATIFARGSSFDESLTQLAAAFERVAFAASAFSLPVRVELGHKGGMAEHLAVGVTANCLAPLGLERLQHRIAVLMGAGSLMVPDHYQGFVPRIVWGPQFSPAAKRIASLDAFFDPFVMLRSMYFSCTTGGRL